MGLPDLVRQQEVPQRAAEAAAHPGGGAERDEGSEPPDPAQRAGGRRGHDVAEHDERLLSGQAVAGDAARELGEADEEVGDTLDRPKGRGSQVKAGEVQRQHGRAELVAEIREEGGQDDAQDGARDPSLRGRGGGILHR